jgi:hypothetical protein
VRRNDCGTRLDAIKRADWSALIDGPALAWRIRFMGTREKARVRNKSHCALPQPTRTKI